MSGKYAFTKSLKEVRFHLCQTSQQSAATRAFLTRAYPTMKKNNPHTPILIREAMGVEPKIWARYEYGKEKMEPLLGTESEYLDKTMANAKTGLDDKAIENKVTELVRAGIGA